MSETSQEVLVSTDNHVATIVIDRPRARNAISRPTMDALHAALDEIESQASIGPSPEKTIR